MSAASDPRQSFWSFHYLRHNQRRLEHLATLGFDFAGRTVLEVGAGIGDLTSFFVDRGARVVTSEGDPRNLSLLRERHPDLEARLIDLEEPPNEMRDTFDIVFCYGVLYHLADPARALDFLAARTGSLLLLETCVSPSAADELLRHQEPPAPENALHGVGCRPSRTWIMRELRQRFAHVYCPLTQPAHEEFPLDWSTPPPNPWLVRATFAASRTPLDSPLLVEDLPMRQRRA